MNNKQLTVLALVLVASVIATPIVYAVVEPHIKITMDVAQTTKPIQIVDDQDVEVFSVDVNGLITPKSNIFTLVAGTEEVIVDHSSFVGLSTIHPVDDDASGRGCFGVEVTLPSTSDLWKISAVELLTGDRQYTAGSSNMDVLVMESYKDELPLSIADDFTGRVLASGSVYDLEIPFPPLNNTVYKIPTFDSFFIEDGTELLVIASVTSNFDIEGRVAISGDVWNQSECPFGSDGRQAGHRVIQTDFGDDTYEFYLKVYAVPYS